jgi:hypothetical protein
MLGPKPFLWEKLLVFFFIWAVVGGMAVLWALMGGGHHPSDGHSLIAKYVIGGVCLVALFGPAVIRALHEDPQKKL